MSQGEHVREFQGDHVGDVGAFGGLEQRGVDAGGRGADAHVHRIALHLGGETRFFAHHFQGLRVADLARQLLDAARGGVGDLDGIPRLQIIEALADAGQIANGGEIGLVEGHAPKDRVHGVIAADHDFDGRGHARLLHAGRGVGLRIRGRPGGGPARPLFAPAAPFAPVSGVPVPVVATADAVSEAVAAGVPVAAVVPG